MRVELLSTQNEWRTPTSKPLDFVATAWLWGTGTANLGDHAFEPIVPFRIERDEPGRCRWRSHRTAVRFDRL